MNTTVKEVLDFIAENDVKFIRLTFCDLLGNQKNISIMPDELPKAFEYGIAFDASAITGFADVTHSDLFLFPNPATLSVLPWRPQHGRVVRFYCDIKNPDGSIFADDPRNILKSVIKKCEDKGYVCKIGAECEFYLFKTDDNGKPTAIPFDNGGYLDVSPLDKGENVRREICLCLEEMGTKPETSHHEQGPGQNEIDFKFSDALSCADNLVTFKTVVRTIAARNGLFASFTPKPLKDKSGSGLHINISLSKNGYNVFSGDDGKHSDIADSFIAGVLKKTKEMTSFLNPVPNSYERFGSFEAPKYISWSHSNRSQLIRIPAAIPENVRMELRSPDPSLNPYLAFALVINAGLEGIDESLSLPTPINENLFTADKSVLDSLDCLPSTMEEALKLTEKSDFVKSTVGKSVLNKFLDCKYKELADFSSASDKKDYYYNHYFKLV